MGEAEIKIFEIKGLMMLSHDSFPTWHKFTVYVRALREQDALEKVFSELGSRHKLKRKHIRIESIRAVSPEEVNDARVLALSQATKVR